MRAFDYQLIVVAVMFVLALVFWGWLMRLRPNQSAKPVIPLTHITHLITLGGQSHWRILPAGADIGRIVLHGHHLPARFWEVGDWVLIQRAEHSTRYRIDHITKQTDGSAFIVIEGSFAPRGVEDLAHEAAT